MKAGLIGCGTIAQVHAQVLNKLPDVKFVGAYDIIPERTVVFAEKYGVKAFKSLEEMLEQIDVLHICLPHYLHTPVAEIAAKRGVAVFTEKPPVISYEQLDRLKDAARVVPLGICFQNRYTRGVQFIKDFMASHVLGEFIGARGEAFWHRDSAYYKQSPWRGKLIEAGGGALMNQTVHTLDLLVYLLGKPSSASATMDNIHLQGQIEVEDSMTISLEIQDKPVLFSASTANFTDEPVFMELIFNNYVIKLNGSTVIIEQAGKKFEEINFSTDDRLGKSYWGDGHESCIHDYYHQLKKELPPHTGIPETEATILTLLASYESARTHKKIFL